MYSASSKAVSIFSLAAANLLQAKQSREINCHVDNNILSAVLNSAKQKVPDCCKHENDLQIKIRFRVSRIDISPMIRLWNLNLLSLIFSKAEPGTEACQEIRRDTFGFYARSERTLATRHCIMEHPIESSRTDLQRINFELSWMVMMQRKTSF